MSQSLSGWDGVFHRARRVQNCRGRRQVAIPFRVGWGFSHFRARSKPARGKNRRNPFQGGMGFFTCAVHFGMHSPGNLSQSLSGWDGVFHSPKREKIGLCVPCRNPFQGGMGFFTKAEERVCVGTMTLSQSLSGWDGVFHLVVNMFPEEVLEPSQSLSGWDGVFHSGFPRPLGLQTRGGFPPTPGLPAQNFQKTLSFGQGKGTKTTIGKELRHPPRVSTPPGVRALHFSKTPNRQTPPRPQRTAAGSPCARSFAHPPRRESKTKPHPPRDR